ncbi:P-type conjugative transfer protein TrbL, partial [Mesorhizobium sp. M5C.F.Cr.IN.023.01.1.1]
GTRAGFVATGGSSSMGTLAGDSGAASVPPASNADRPPAWAQRMRRGGHMGHGVSAAAHAVRSGDSHASGASVNLSEGDRT